MPPLVPYLGGAAEMAPTSGDPGLPGQALWLMPSFRTDADTSMTMYYGIDGKTWKALSNTPFWTTSSPGAAGVSTRDPRLLQRNGRFYVCFTTVGWGAGTSFDIIESNDLLTWELTARVSTAAVPNALQTWSPKWFVDNDDSVHICVNVSAVLNDGPFKQYQMRATAEDLKTWSTPVEITGLPSNTIDGVWFRKPGDPLYYFWFKNETSKYLEVYTSTSLVSGYTAYKTGNWAGWGRDIEGISLIPLANNQWRVYFDKYPLNGIYYSDSLDDWATWSTKALAITPTTQSNPGPYRTMHNVATRLTLLQAIINAPILANTAYGSAVQAAKFPTLSVVDGAGDMGSFIGLGGAGEPSGYRATAITANLRRDLAAANWRLNDTSKPAWLVVQGFDTYSDAFEVYRAPATTGTPIFTRVLRIDNAGRFFPLQAASAPDHANGAMYFDTTLNKLRIGGAAGWETITSS